MHPSSASLNPARAALLGLLLLVPFAFCQETPTVLGHIRSSGATVKLNGVEVPFAGTREWPIVAGDEILTDSAAFLVFFEGSRVTLASRTRVRIESADARTKVRLLDGFLQFKLSDPAKVDIYNRSFRQTGSAGNVSTAASGRANPPASSAGRIRTESLPPLSRSR